jgi:hypothetical protein
MPRKPPRPRQTADPEQHKRFLDMAREVEVDETPKAFDRAFERVIGRPQKTASQAHSGQNRSRRKRDAEGSQ